MRCTQTASIRFGRFVPPWLDAGGVLSGRQDWNSSAWEGILHAYGAVAQLGERLLCKQEVVGSIPIGSIDFPPNAFQPSAQ